MLPIRQTTRIESLTPDQEVRLKAWHAEWLGIGTCTDVADRRAAESAVSAMYQAVKEQPPSFIWCQSPATALLAIAWLKSQPQSQRPDSLRDSLWASLGDSLRDSLWASLWASLGDSLWASLRASLRDSLRDSLWASLRDSLWASLGDSLRDSLFWGQHEAYWIASYLFAEEIGVYYDTHRSQQLHWWETLARSTGWWWPYRGVCIMSERPITVIMEPNPRMPNRYRLHCGSGPALLYRDGWAVYVWHGMRVAAELIERPETITPAQIAAEGNAEVRRVMLERVGYERYIRESGAKQLHRDDWGTLWQAPLVGDEPLTMVEVLNSTPEPSGSFKTYFLRVPPTMRTAREAVAWTFDVPAERYNPIIQT